MKHYFRAIAGLFLIAISSAAMAQDSFNQDTPLGHHRLLVLCLLDSNYAQNAKLDLLYKNTDWVGFSERDLFFVEMKNDSWSIVNGQMVLNSQTGQKDAKWRRVKNLSSNLALRSEAACHNDFEFVLIGNDGTQKSRWKNSIPSDELFTRIDSMPLRQLEIRYQNK